MLNVIVSIVVFCGLMEVVFSPRLDKTDEGDTLLWYTGMDSKRKYFKL